MTTVYLIEYFDNYRGMKVRYLNNTSFPTEDQAEREITLIKKFDQRFKENYGGKVRRTKFKVIPHIINDSKRDIK